MRYGSKTAYAQKRAALMPSIDLHPKEIELRDEGGYLEDDTVTLKEGRLHTLVERKSRFLFANFSGVLGMGLAMQISASAVRMLSSLPHHSDILSPTIEEANSDGGIKPKKKCQT